MLYTPKTRIRTSKEWAINSSAGTLNEGMVLVNAWDATNSIFGALASAGSANDVPLGFALNVWQTPTTAKYVDIITVPSGSPYTGTLSNTPVSPSATTISAILSSTGQTALTYNTGVASTQFSVTNSTQINFNSAQAGNTYYVTYTYTLSVQQAISLYGDGVVLKRAPSQITNSIGVILEGEVWTDQYDASQNWYSQYLEPSAIITGANGLLTQTGTGSGVQFGNCRLISPPTNSVPFLGLYISN